MRVTSALLVRQFIAKLHPPLPGSAKEAQKLAALLQSSFKRHLDEQHPAPQTDGLLRPAGGHLPINVSSVSGEATHRHLEAILDHPLLQENQSVSSLDLFSQRKLALWDQAAMENLINLAFVEKILCDYDELREKTFRMSTELCKRIVAWFSTANNKLKEKLLTRRDTISKVLPLLYSAKREDVAWEWLSLLYSGDLKQGNFASQFDTRSVPWLNYEDHFVSCMVKESLKKRSLTTAATEYVEACSYRAQSGRASTTLEASVRTGNLPYQPLWWTWKLLSTSILQKNKAHGIPAELFDQVMSFSVPTHTAFWIDVAFLHLYRPQGPSTKQLLARLSNPVWVSSFLAWKDTRSVRFQKSLVSSVLDAAQMELEARHTSSSSDLVDFAAKHFSTFVSRSRADDLGECIDHARSNMQLAYPSLTFG